MMERSIHGQFHKPHHLGSLPSKFIQVDKAPHPPWSASVKGCVVWNVKGSDETVATSQRISLRLNFICSPIFWTHLWHIVTSVGELVPNLRDVQKIWPNCVVVQHVEPWKQGPPRVVDIQNLKLVLETLEPSRRHPFRQGEVLMLRGWRVGKKAAGQP